MNLAFVFLAVFGPRLPRRAPPQEGPGSDEARARGIDPYVRQAARDPEVRSGFFGRFAARSKTVDRALNEEFEPASPRHPDLVKAMRALRGDRHLG